MAKTRRAGGKTAQKKSAPNKASGRVAKKKAVAKPAVKKKRAAAKAKPAAPTKKKAALKKAAPKKAAPEKKAAAKAAPKKTAPKAAPKKKTAPSKKAAPKAAPAKKAAPQAASAKKAAPKAAPAKKAAAPSPKAAPPAPAPKAPPEKPAALKPVQKLAAAAKKLAKTLTGGSHKAKSDGKQAAPIDDDDIGSESIPPTPPGEVIRVTTDQGEIIAHPDAGLTARQITFLHQKLLEERTRKIAELDRHMQEALSEAGVMPDETDMAQRSTEQAYLIRFADKERKLLGEIERALEKLRLGDYGVCEGTEEPIGFKRLELRPWTRYSVAYKEQIERERSQHRR